MRIQLHSAHVALLLLVACNAGCRASGSASVAPPPLHQGLGDSKHEVATDSAEAQAYFDQGLALAWGFNHEESVRSFLEAARLDPDCAMTRWGLAYVLGPNLNQPLTARLQAARAHEAVERARELSGEATELERELIEALSRRYEPVDASSEEELDREERGDPLDQAYADAMQAVYERHPDDPMVGVLYADALMNLSLDWRAWGIDEERGERTPEIVRVLEHVLALAPDHPGANHFYIHAVEGSTTPERALPSARRLGGLMPAAGHMVHMPSHIYIRLGMYDEAVESNARAVIQDDRFFALEPRVGRYHMYRAHNHHFLTWAAMFRGSREDALETARVMVSKLPDDSAAYPGIDTYRFVPMHVLMRFGDWEAMLEEPAPGPEHSVSTALWHHGRAVALANTERCDEARLEAALFEESASEIPDTTLVRRAVIEDFVKAARHMMWGEILFKEGDHEAAFAELRAGIEIEDSLPYSEPPGWMQPIRHSLGALLLEDGRVEEAESVYRADLDRHRDNVWSLRGLAECLRRRGEEAEALAVEARFAEVAVHADVSIEASCYCRDMDA